jgi:hypothetical protein
MTEERPEHLPDAIAHAVVPPAETPAEAAAPPPPPSRGPVAVAVSVESGPTVELIEQLFPLAWLAMLTVVSVIGVYNAVSRLP